MKPLARFLLTLALVASSSGALADKRDISLLAWLAGCWRIDGTEPGSGELWLPLAGQSMAGVSRVVKDGKSVNLEFMRIVIGDNGVLQYVAQPIGQKETSFEAVDVGPDSAAFVNPAHDYPQRIAYRRLDAESMLGSIDGKRGGSRARMDFPMRKVACEELGAGKP